LVRFIQISSWEKQENNPEPTYQYLFCSIHTIKL
jgi:hypothetical protein